MDRAEWTILGLHVWALTKTFHDHACNNVIMYRLARRYGANHCFHVTRVYGFFLFSFRIGSHFDASLHQRRDMRLWQGPAVCSQVAQENL